MGVVSCVQHWESRPSNQVAPVLHHLPVSVSWMCTHLSHKIHSIFWLYQIPRSHPTRLGSGGFIHALWWQTFQVLPFCMHPYAPWYLSLTTSLSLQYTLYHNCKEFYTQHMSSWYVDSNFSFTLVSWDLILHPGKQDLIPHPGKLRSYSSPW